VLAIVYYQEGAPVTEVLHQQLNRRYPCLIPKTKSDADGLRYVVRIHQGSELDEGNVPTEVGLDRRRYVKRQAGLAAPAGSGQRQVPSCREEALDLG
jgi:hypothetical protein